MRLGLGVVAALMSAGCVVTQNPDAAPGDMVWTENQSISWMPAGLSGGKAGMANWTRIRVIAPVGATRCVSGSASPLIQGGPQAEGKPGKNREVMLTTDPESLTVHVRCSMPAGDVVRSVDGYRYEKYYKITRRTSGLDIQPPLVHMDPSDPDAPARWDRLHAEICSGEIGPRGGFLCQPEIFAALKAADLGREP